LYTGESGGISRFVGIDGCLISISNRETDIAICFSLSMSRIKIYTDFFLHLCIRITEQTSFSLENVYSFCRKLIVPVALPEADSSLRAEYVSNIILKTK